jgi:hypothetical protein
MSYIFYVKRILIILKLGVKNVNLISEAKSNRLSKIKYQIIQSGKNVTKERMRKIISILTIETKAANIDSITCICNYQFFISNA